MSRFITEYSCKKAPTRSLSAVMANELAVKLFETALERPHDRSVQYKYITTMTVACHRIHPVKTAENLQRAQGLEGFGDAQ